MTSTVYKFSFKNNERQVADAKIHVTNTGVYVNQAKIDKINNPSTSTKHIYSRQRLDSDKVSQLN